METSWTDQQTLVLLAVSFSIFTGYVLGILISFGFLKSLSASYYALQKENKWLFTIALWGFAFPLILVAETPLMFLAGVGICFTGAAPAFKETLTSTVHNVGAFTGVIAGYLNMVIYYDMYIFSSITFVLIAIIFFSKLNSKTLFSELIAFYSILGSILYSIL